MTLRDCMRYAISNSTKIRIQQAATGDARIERRDAALALFTPQISAQTYAYYTRIDNDAQARFDLPNNQIDGIGAGSSPTGFGVGIKHVF